MLVRHSALAQRFWPTKGWSARDQDVIRWLSQRFLNGNPAITLGNIIYFKPSYFKRDFASPLENIPLLLHEFTHAIQWDRIGHVRFLQRYNRERKVAGGASRTYHYGERSTTFAHEMLEGQTQMVQDYTRYRIRVPPGQEAQAADLKRRLAGSRVYGL